MKKFITLLILFSIASLGYAQNITMVTYHPSKYGNYDTLDTSGDTTLASETSSSEVTFASLTSPYDVSVVQLDTTTVTSNFLVGDADPTVDLNIAETLTLTDTLEIEGNLTVDTSANSGNISIEDFTVHDVGDVTGTFAVGNDLKVVGNGDFASGNFNNVSGSNMTIDNLQIKKSNGTYWTFNESGMTKSKRLTWDTIIYLRHSSTETARKTLLVMKDL